MLPPLRATSGKRRACEPLAPVVYHDVVAHVGGQGPSPQPGPLKNGGGDLEAYPRGILHPPKAVTALVQEVHIDNWVIHQVFPDSRKVDQRRYVVEGELSSWSDARKHQNLYTNV